MNATLLFAADIARRAHIDQFDRFTGEPYIEHPIRVAQLVRRRKGTNDEVIGALLHDVLEDCGAARLDAFETEIRECFGFNMLARVKALSRQSNEDYATYIKRTKLQPDTRLIKLCDIDDHLDFARLSDVLGISIAADIRIKYDSMFNRYTKSRLVLMS